MTRLKELRLAAGLSQATLAARAGISLSTMIRYESGASQPSVGRIESLCLALDVEPSALLGWQATEVDQPVVTGDPSPGQRPDGSNCPALSAVGDPVLPSQLGPRPARPDAGIPSYYR